jgi:hypothetical protein
MSDAMPGQYLAITNSRQPRVANFYRKSKLTREHQEELVNP